MGVLRGPDFVRSPGLSGDGGHRSTAVAGIRTLGPPVVRPPFDRSDRHRPRYPAHAMSLPIQILQLFARELPLTSPTPLPDGGPARATGSPAGHGWHPGGSTRVNPV